MNSIAFIKQNSQFISYEVYTFKRKWSYLSLQPKLLISKIVFQLLVDIFQLFMIIFFLCKILLMIQFKILINFDFVLRVIIDYKRKVHMSVYSSVTKYLFKNVNSNNYIFRLTMMTFKAFQARQISRYLKDFLPIVLGVN